MDASDPKAVERLFNMNELLAGILDAHSGADHWNRYEKVEATIVSGGFFTLKGVPQCAKPRRIGSPAI
jgi:hypothetical protein